MKIHEKHEKTKNRFVAKSVFRHLTDVGLSRDFLKWKCMMKMKKEICLVEIFDFRFLKLKSFIFVIKSMKIMENTGKLMKNHEKIVIWL